MVLHVCLPYIFDSSVGLILSWERITHYADDTGYKAEFSYCQEMVTVLRNKIEKVNSN